MPRLILFPVFSRRVIATASLFTLLIAGASTAAFGQGCVAARGCGLLEHMEHMDALEMAEFSPWEVSVGFRWFKSDRHFRGIHEEPERQEEGSEVINRSYYIDFGINYTISPRYSASLTLPFVSHNRSQTVRDANRVPILRYSTDSSGLADMRVEGRGWLWNPADSMSGNILFGVGLELPTGKKDATDFFTGLDSTSGEFYQQERTVDQSIQPGDGGWAVLLSTYAYRRLAPGLTGFFSGVYAIAPEETNGVPTFRSRIWESEMSIADSYLARLGAEYILSREHGLIGSLALRLEGVPVQDLIGGSEGFRRPGYAVAIEPGLAINHGSWNGRIYVPIAIQRNRQQSVPDQQRTAATGTYAIGDAAFADYSIIGSLSYRF